MQVVRPLRELEKFGKQYIQFGRWEKSGGSPEHSTWPENPQYLISVSSMTDHVQVSLLQQDWKIFSRDSEKPSAHIGMLLLRIEENRSVKVHRIQHITALAEYTNGRECCFRISVSDLS